MKRILVVEDDRIIGEMLKYMLTFRGYKVWIQQHPDEIADFILKNRIDMVVMDNLLGVGENGLQICSGLKKKHIYGACPHHYYVRLL
ncbi:MAG: response regulator [Aequorivita sp.]